jgi:sugar O-acyltransferase (sialic acid O-acetyltransferase NeuD family)
VSGLTLVAASGLAREVMAVLPRGGREVRVLDDDPAKAGSHVGGALVEGGLELITNHPHDQVLVCAGRGAARRAIVARLTALGVGPDRYATVVHPSVDVPDTCTIGPGSILLAQVVLTSDVRVGSHVVAMPHVTLTHDVVVDDFATLCAGVTLGGGVHIRSGAYLGMSSSVREDLTVGADAVLGMGAALVADLPPGEVWTGVPAHAASRAAGRAV